MVPGLWEGFRSVIPASLPKANRTRCLPQDNLPGGSLRLRSLAACPGYCPFSCRNASAFDRLLRDLKA